MKKPMNQFSPDPYLALLMETYREGLRQVRQAHNIHIAAIFMSVVVSVFGFCLLLKGETTGGTVTAATGVGASAFCSRIAKVSSKESERKLNKLMKDIRTYHVREPS